MSSGGEYSPAMMSEDPFRCCINDLTMKKKKSNKNNNNNQRRFSDEQIKSLELMFESETRLEPRKKVQLARELGLHPRQVAIWFQNKRARWKSKQLEKEYTILNQNYTNLASQFESLKKEKQGLVSELQRLKEEMKKTEEEEGMCCDQAQAVALSSTDHESENEENPPEVRPEEIYEKSHGVISDEDNNNIKTEYFGGFEQEPNLMNIVEQADSCLTSSDDWRGFKSDTLLDQSSSSYPWWDFWS